MSVVERKIPKGTEPIIFLLNNNPRFGMINLCCWEEDITNITSTKKINNTMIKIHFPVFQDFFVKEYQSGSGFTFRELINMIVKTGLLAGEYAIHNYPEAIFDLTTFQPSDFIGEYAITSTNKESDIEIKGDNIYVSVQH